MNTTTEHEVEQKLDSLEAQLERVEKSMVALVKAVDRHLANRQAMEDRLEAVEDRVRDQEGFLANVGRTMVTWAER